MQRDWPTLTWWTGPGCVTCTALRSCNTAILQDCNITKLQHSSVLASSSRTASIRHTIYLYGPSDYVQCARCRECRPRGREPEKEDQADISSASRCDEIQSGICDPRCSAGPDGAFSLKKNVDHPTLFLFLDLAYVTISSDKGDAIFKFCAIHVGHAKVELHVWKDQWSSSSLCNLLQHQETPWIITSSHVTVITDRATMSWWSTEAVLFVVF